MEKSTLEKIFVKIILIISIISVSALSLSSERSSARYESFAVEDLLGLIKIELNATSEGYYLEVKDQDMIIKGGTLFFSTQKNTIKFDNKDISKLSGFFGKVLFNDSTIILDGKVTAIENSNTRIISNNLENVRIKMMDALVMMDSALIDSFSEQVSGEARLDEKATFNLNHEEVGLTGFFGDVNIDTKGNIILSGSVDFFNTELKKISVESRSKC